jgi:hypothetical protein
MYFQLYILKIVLRSSKKLNGLKSITDKGSQITKEDKVK